MKNPCSLFAKALTLVTASLMLLGTGTTLLAQTQLNPVGARNTDGRIHKDLNGYQTQQNALKLLNDPGKFPVDSYAFAKAQCWLDVSFHEYTRNDRSPFAQLALNESYKLTQAMQGGTSNTGDQNLNTLAAQTPLINDADRVRNDLWARADRLKQTPGYGGFNFCAERQVACAEVELVHAGNEARQQGWRHSRPYIQIAESNLNQAAVSIEQCYKQPVVQTVVKEVVVEKVVERIVQRVVDVPAPAKPVVELPFNLSTTVLFNYKKRDLAKIRPFTKTLLDDFVAKIKQANISGVPFKVQSIQVIGHADRTNNTGIPNYNSLLAQDRAVVIKQYLVSKGIAQTVVTSTVMGDTTTGRGL